MKNPPLILQSIVSKERFAFEEFVFSPADEILSIRPIFPTVIQPNLKDPNIQRIPLKKTK
jgi:hypothetical protein